MRRASAALLVSLAAVVSGCGSSGNGSSAKDALTAQLNRDVARWIAAEKLPPGAARGAHLYAFSGCTACHLYLGSGTSVGVSPDLTAEASLGRGRDWQIRHLRCPACVVDGSSMPKYGSLGEKTLRQLAVFLEASKGKR